MPFLPENQSLQALLNSFVDPQRFSAAFDNAYKQRLMEQQQAGQLFDVLARTNPDLGRFLSAQPGVVESLTKSPRTFQPNAAGKALEKAASSYAPATARGGKPSTTTAAAGYVAKVAQGYETAFKKPLPAGAVKRATDLLASGQMFTGADIGLSEEELNRAVAASGDTQMSLQREVYNGLVETREKALGRPLNGEEKAQALLDITTGKSEDLRAKLAELTVGRLEDAARMAQLMQEFQSMRNETARTKPLSAKELAETRKLHDQASFNATQLTKLANSFSTLDLNNPGAFLAFQNDLALIQGDDPAAESIRRALNSAISLMSTSDPGQRAQLIQHLRGIFLQARDHFSVMESDYGNILQTQSSKPAKPGKKTKEDMSLEDELQSIIDEANTGKAPIELPAEGEEVDDDEDD